MPLRNLIVILLTAGLSVACYQKAQRNRYASVIGEAMGMVEHHYIEEVDRRELFESAMRGMMQSLDQYSGYISPEAFESIEVVLDQEFGGVGVEIEKRELDEPLTVLSPIVGTPAYRAGIGAGDQILKIDGTSTVGLEMKDAVRFMRGKPGTEVLLTILHPGDEDPVEITVIREVIMVDSVLGDTRRPDDTWDFHLAANRRIGYFRLTTFGKHTGDELARALNSDEQLAPPFEAMILDLRGNAGGLLDAAVDVCRLFISNGVIVSTSDREGNILGSYFANGTAAVPQKIPIAVLVNSYSASASEIVAACLQDHERAVIVGSRTWGKGTVQNIFELEGGRSALKLTTAGYQRPSGENIHRRKNDTEDDKWGVSPNEGFEVVVSDEESQALSRQRRRQDILANGNPNGAVKATEPVDPASADPADEAPQDVEDRQLNQAIEFLEKELRQIDAQSRSA
jgi:carboxyl-terminal processing protease